MQANQVMKIFQVTSANRFKKVDFLSKTITVKAWLFQSEMNL